MKTRIYPGGGEANARAAAAVAAGSVIAFRTDTFYGLGANPLDGGALGAINDLKGREGKPILVVLSDAAEAPKMIAEATPLFEHLARAHWPGALTLVARARAGLPEELTAGTGTIGVRLPADEEVRGLVRACGGALTATSANPAGRAPARSAAEVVSYFPEGLALVVDGGEVRTEQPSTVLDVSGVKPKLIREGVATRAALERTLRGIGLDF
jgi:L-threonylcarbamoyladenylate synthase